MSFWLTKPVSEEPEIRLVHWAIFELPDGDRHFAGCADSGGGRVSSKVVSFDPATRRGVTRTGRVYELGGAPGLDWDGMYVWEGWKRVNRVESAVDVSDQLEKRE